MPYMLDLPLITPCGHVFRYSFFIPLLFPPPLLLISSPPLFYSTTCLVRYLEAESQKKCPTCSHMICREELRLVIQHTDLEHTHLKQPDPDMRQREDGDEDGCGSYEVGREALFGLLMCEKGGLCPRRVHCPSSATSPSPSSPLSPLCSLPFYFPSIASPDATYSRCCVASRDDLLLLTALRRQQIEAFRVGCITSSSTPPLALTIKEQDRRQETGNSLTPGPQLNLSNASTIRRKGVGEG